MATLSLRQDNRPHPMASVVNALGTDAFERETLRYLHDMAGAEHYSVYRLRDGEAQFLAGASAYGPLSLRERSIAENWTGRSYVELHQADELTQSSDEVVVLHQDIDRIADPTLHSMLEHFDIVDRVMLCGRPLDELYALAVLRSRESGQFDQAELDALAESADLLIAMCAKHAALHLDRKKTIANFASIEVIEDNLRASDWGLSERELQVSARILFGISAYGIALDLGLGEETIATYRKRLYARLKIGGRHELLQRYLSLL